jgi:hypothetical protein
MRLAKLSYDPLSPEQKVAWDEVVAGPRKKMHGPFFIWLHSPELLSRGQKLGLYARFQSSLPQRSRQSCPRRARHSRCRGGSRLLQPHCHEHEGLCPATPRWLQSLRAIELEPCAR